MKYLVTTAIVAGLLITPVRAEQAACKAQAAEEGTKVVCKKRVSKGQGAARDRGLTRADEDRLDRAMSRNVLQSIDEQLGRQRGVR